VPPTLQGYERISQQRVAEALISRGNQRWQNVYSNVDESVALLAAAIESLPLIDEGLAAHRPHLDSLDRETGERIGQVIWTSDSLALAFRFLSIGQVMGAAVAIRADLERTTRERAESHGVAFEGFTEEIFRRSWGQLPLNIDVIQCYRATSELLHGRGPLLRVVNWEGPQLARGLDQSARDGLVLLAQACGAIGLHLREVIARSLRSYGEVEAANSVERGVGRARPGAPLSWSFSAFLPLTHDLLESPQLEALSRYLSAPIHAIRRAVDPAYLAFLQRRRAAIETAHEALLMEKRRLGSAFRVQGVQEKATYLAWIVEAAYLVSTWLDAKPQSSALVTAATAQRIAFAYWLEDDPRCLAAARTVLESVARLRAWRLKPQRAVRVEDRGSDATPRDWWEAAGWRRLTELARSLSEFAHWRPTPQWTEASRYLEHMATFEIPGSEHPQTRAKGVLIERTSLLLLSETMVLLGRMSPALLSKYSNETGIRQDADFEHELEEWLSRNWTARRFRIGEARLQ